MLGCWYLVAELHFYSAIESANQLILIGALFYLQVQVQSTFLSPLQLQSQSQLFTIGVAVVLQHEQSFFIIILFCLFNIVSLK